MKHRHAFEVITESYEEEQFMLYNFPDAWWEIRGVNAVFVFPPDRESAVLESLQEFEQLKKESGMKGN